MHGNKAEFHSGEVATLALSSIPRASCDESRMRLQPRKLQGAPGDIFHPRFRQVYCVSLLFETVLRVTKIKVILAHNQGWSARGQAPEAKHAPSPGNEQLD